MKNDTEREKREEGEKFKFRKKRYFGVLLFLVFVSSIYFININVACSQNQTGNQSELSKLVQDATPLDAKAAAQLRADAYMEMSNPFGMALQAGKWMYGKAGGIVLDAFNWLLYNVYKLMGVLIVIAGILFDWVVDARVFKSVMDMPAIVTGWTIVRDFLNIFFILVLLFSAFCTIFQIDKYHLIKGKVLLNVVLMALLVNFSYPICRFFIDAANIPMYFFLSVLRGGGTGSFSANVGSWSNVAALLDPGQFKGTTDETLALIASIIFLFIFAITLLVMAVLLVVRMLMLAILIIFSPVGFVANIFPGFSTYGSKWWDALFKNAFFGPIMAFMLYLATTVMVTFNNDIGRTGEYNKALVSRLIENGVKMAVPITLLWIGMMMAKYMGAAGANYVTGKGAALIKGAGKKFSGYNALKRQTDAYKSARKKREDEKAKKRYGGRIGGWLNRKQDSIIGNVSPTARKRADKWRTEKNKEDIKDEADKMNSVGTINIVNNMTNNIDGSTTPSTRDEKIKAAAEAREALSRGKELEIQIENKGISGGLNSFVMQQITAGNLAIGATWGTHENQIKALYYSEMRKLINEGENAK